MPNLCLVAGGQESKNCAKKGGSEREKTGGGRERGRETEEGKEREKERREEKRKSKMWLLVLPSFSAGPVGGRQKREAELLSEGYQPKNEK